MHFFASILVCFLLGKAIHDVEGIINGHDATEGQFPHMAYLQASSGRCSYVCGGALLTKKHIMTAAHCVAMHRTGNIKVALGVTDFHNKPSMQQRNVEHIKVHSEYKGGRRKSLKNWYRSVRRTFTGPSGDPEYNDIAIITLSQEVTLGPAIKTINLPPKSYQLPFGQDARLSGWGRTVIVKDNDPIPPLTTHLQWLDMKVLDPQDAILTDSEFLADKEYGDGTWSNAAKGDSGSPLVKDNQVIGVAVAVSDEEHTTRFQIVTYYLDWIKRYAGLA